jgi:outer membrane murein-binding lipoprotein Lpp
VLTLNSKVQAIEKSHLCVKQALGFISDQSRLLAEAANDSANKGNNKITEHRKSYKEKVKTHKYINRKNQSTTGKL